MITENTHFTIERKCTARFELSSEIDWKLDVIEQNGIIQ
jgi:hypothetical protein